MRSHYGGQLFSPRFYSNIMPHHKRKLRFLLTRLYLLCARRVSGLAIHGLIGVAILKLRPLLAQVIFFVSHPIDLLNPPTSTSTAAPTTTPCLVFCAEGLSDQVSHPQGSHSRSHPPSSRGVLGFVFHSQPCCCANRNTRFACLVVRQSARCGC